MQYAKILTNSTLCTHGEEENEEQEDATLNIVLFLLPDTGEGEERQEGVVMALHARYANYFPSSRQTNQEKNLENKLAE